MEEESRTPGSELRVAVAGPLTSIALAALFWGVYRALPPGFPPLAATVVGDLAWINARQGSHAGARRDAV